MKRASRVAALVALCLAPVPAAANPVREAAAAWDRAQPGPGPSGDPYAEWSVERRQQMRGLHTRFCGNLEMVLPGRAFPFPDTAACVARQEALLPRLCDAEGASRARPQSGCFAAVNRDMRTGLNRLHELRDAQAARDVGAEAPARTAPVERAGPAASGRAEARAGLPPLAAGEPLPRPPRPAPERERRPDEVFAIVQNSVWVVVIEAGQPRRPLAQGSAVAVGPRHLLTNCHLLRGAQGVVLRQGGERRTARLVAADDATDRCVLQAEGAPLAPVAHLRAAEEVRVGERVFAIGAPLGLELSLSDGIVSARRELRGVALVQTTAVMAPGSSGGGLFDSRGNLVGITSFGARGEAGLNFAIAAAGFWSVAVAR